MRNATPLRWIEQAEARQVLASALFETAPLPPRYRTVRAAASERLARMLAMISPGDLIGWPLLQAQPALIRPRASHHRRR